MASVSKAKSSPLLHLKLLVSLLIILTMVFVNAHAEREEDKERERGSNPLLRTHTWSSSNNRRPVVVVVGFNQSAAPVGSIRRRRASGHFFKELLKTSKRDFHTMFLQTYGLLYERNSYIFTDMFQELENYYSGGGIELNDVLDAFFHRLYSKMFQVLNAQYTFDDVYLKCVSEKMEELKPFGDIPKKLKIEVRRSFVATRTFVQSMNSAALLFDKISEISSSADCSAVISVFSSCPSCVSSLPSSPSSPKFCPFVCPATLSKCLTPHSELNEEWNKFVQAMLNLIGRLETSFNIESVVDPIDIKISEAIMNFQENGIEVSHKLFDQCGKPKIGKRDVSYQHQNYAGSRSNSRGSGGSSSSGSRSFPIDSTRYNRAPSASPQSSPGASIERLLEDVKRKVKRSKDYWIRLPTVICSHRRFASITRTSESLNCWNGSTIITDTSSSSESAAALAVSLKPKSFRRSSSSMSAYSSPEQSAIVKQVISRIKLITRKLNFAFNGLDVKWSDDYSDTDLVNGNGSGSGDSEDDDDDDDEGDGGEDGRSKENDNRRGEDNSHSSSSGNSGNNNNGIYDSSTTSSATTDEIDRAARNKWSTTKSPIITLNYSSSSSCVTFSAPFLIIITSAILTMNLRF